MRLLQQVNVSRSNRNIGAGIAQMTGAIELPTPEQVAADKARRQDTPGKTHSRTDEEG